MSDESNWLPNGPVLIAPPRGSKEYLSGTIRQCFGIWPSHSMLESFMGAWESRPLVTAWLMRADRFSWSNSICRRFLSINASVRAIAAFLDRETARTDALIERKRRQIELLQEKRSALINHAVTKGLDSHAPMKDSGVEWFGDVPEHWSPGRLRYRAKINSSRSELDGTPGTLDISFVPMESVHEYGGLSLDQTRPLAEVATGYTYFRDGDVLAAKITPCFENGKGSIAQDLVNGIGCGTTELHVLRPYASLGRRFLFYVTISHAFRHLGAGEMYGAGGQKRVPEDFFRNFRKPIPPLAEQRAIAALLDRETARIDGLIEKVEQSIATLREHRTALISAAVTGKIDVRGEVA